MTHSSSSFDPLLVTGKPLLGVAVRSGLFILIAKVFRYGFVFLTQIILMNILNPADFGLMRYVTLVLGIVNLINEAGLGVALVQKKGLHKNEIASSFSLVLFVCMGLYGILFLIAPLMASFFGNIKLIDLIRIGGLCAPLGGISIVHRSIMQRQFLYGRLSLIEASSAFIGSAVGIILGLLGFGVWSLIWSVLIYSSISSFLSILFSNSIRGNFFDFKSSTALWLFGLSAVIQRIIDYGSSNIDFIVVGKFFGEHALGIYSVAFMAITVPQLAFGAILVNVAISAFSRFQDDDQRLREAFIRLTKVVAGISIPFFVLIFLLAPEIMQTIGFIKHSNKWIPAAPLIKILAPMGLIYCLNSYPSIVWIAKGKIKLRIIWALFSLVTMSGAVIIGAKFGVSGICKAILTRAIIVFPISCYVNYRTFGLSPVVYLKAITSPLCCGVLAMIVLQGWALIGGSYFTHHSYLKLLCYSITCMLIYGLTLRIVSKGVYRDFCSVIKELVKTKRV